MTLGDNTLADQPWHLVQISDVLDLEFASALAETTPVLAWKPQRSIFPGLVRPGKELEETSYLTPSLQATDNILAPVRTRHLPLLRGFARPPMSWFANTDDLLARLLNQTPDPANSPLICSTPFFAPLAERWPGPVIYWLTDLIAEYSSASREQVGKLDRRMCRAATLVCPNSHRIKLYLMEQASCDPDKIQLLPNATRASNVFAEAPLQPSPEPIPSTGRPVAGVIGNLAGNMDWRMLERLLQLTPWLSWVFVGPVSMHMVDPVARRARVAVMEHPNTTFVGLQPYGALAGFARSFDVAVLPYVRREPTYSGSSTRFYEHLAACRPMISTRCLEELNRKGPLLTLVDSAEQAANKLEVLRRIGFNDGLTHLRWQTSRVDTWQCRAATMKQALQQRLGTARDAEMQPVYSVVA